MTWENSNITPQTAVERGWQTWDVYLTNWARLGGGDTNSLQFPFPLSQAIIPSINGVGIGPYSDMDRVKIQFNPNVEVPGGSFPAVLNEANEKFLSIEAPIIYPLSGPIVVVADIEALVGDLPGETFIADDGSNTVTSFDFANLSTAPRLHLVFYLQASIVQPLRRYPKNFSGVLSFGGASVFQKALPIMGRKQGRVTFNSIGPDTASIRLGLIGPRDRTNNRMIEKTLTTLSVGINQTASFTFGGDNHDTQFLSVWAAADGGTAAVYYNMEFTDVPGGGCTCISGPPT